MKSTEQLEREHEETRASLNQTLDELRSRVTPGQVLDELVDYARGTNGGLMVRNLGQRVVDNPLPLALIGTGLAWLMTSDARARRARTAGIDTSDIRSAARWTADAAGELAGSTRSFAHDAARSTRSAARDVGSTMANVRSTVRDTAARSADAAGSALDSMRDAASRTGDAASSALDSMRDAASRTGDAASSAIDTARSAASSTYQRATRATRRATSAIGDSSVAVVRSVQDRGQDFVEFCREQPLVVAGLGLALGAALGAVLPVTEAEDRLIGEASDDVKERMQRVASKVKEGATSAYQQVADETRSSQASRQPSASATEVASASATGGADTGTRAMSSHDDGSPRPMSSSADPRMLRPGDECADLPSENERR